MNPIRGFIDHPASVGESYSTHLVCAAGFGLRMMFGGVACLIHAVFPFLFERTGSDTVCALNDCLRSRRRIAEGLGAQKRLAP
jgi:uncharacterized protein DUF6356